MAGRPAAARVREEVPHLAVGDVLLELRQRRRRVAAGEATDRHERRAGLQLEIAHRIEPIPAAAQRLSRPCTISASAAFSAVRARRSTGPPGPPGPPGRRVPEAVGLLRTRHGAGPVVRARNGLDRVGRRRRRGRKGSPPRPRPRWPCRAGALRRPAAPRARPNRPARPTASQAASPGVRSSSTKAHTPVAAASRRARARGTEMSRRATVRATAMPTSAAIAGASATV